ncbi:MAG: SPOR domain-containing protein [Lysobacterales bacterium]
MDDALRQRLVGAAVIIALAVIFVPMLLDTPQQPVGTQQVDLSIPPREESGLETRRLPLDPNTTAPQPSSEAPLPAADRDVAEPVQAPAEGGVAAVSDTPPVTPPAAAPTPKPLPPAAAPANPPAPRPSSTPPAQTPKPTPPVATPAPAAPTLPAPAQGGRYVAQFGSYAERANAETLVRDLAKVGVPAIIEALPSAGGRTLHRVRSKPYATRTEADAARLGAQRQIAGLASTVVELAAADATQSAPPRTGMSGWAVQVGVFSKKEGADELVARLRAGGYAAFVEPIKLAGGQTSHRVRVGPEVKRENATRIQGEIKSKYKLDALVVAHP